MANIGYVRDDEAVGKSRETEAVLFQKQESGIMDLVFPVFGQHSRIEKRSEELNQDSKFWDWDWNSTAIDHLAAWQSGGGGGDDSQKEKPQSNSFSVASWDVLNGQGVARLMTQEENFVKKLWSVEILRIAGQRLIELSRCSKIDGMSMFIHPHGSSLLDLSTDDGRDLELMYLLLAAGDNLACQRMDLATNLISQCLCMASDSGTPVQRLAFYFAEALQEKINGNEKKRQEIRREGLALGTNNTFLLSHQDLPFAQAMQFAGIQAILEAVKTSSSGKIHIIDLQIRSGIQWTGLIQGLAEYLTMTWRLKITAVGTNDQTYMEETGRQLKSFANSLDLCFSFEAVYLTDMEGFKVDLLSIDVDETVAVYSYMMLRSMLSTPDQLENVMREIASLKPAVMVVTEVEANHNSPSFVDRFIEALFFYCAFFDCLEDCMERGSACRAILEGTYFRQGILDIVAGEGRERITRNVGVDVWRAFFSRFGMVEIELSLSSKLQASLVVKQFGQGSSCRVECNGKGVTVGWKGIPLHSLTAWNFS